MSNENAPNLDVKTKSSRRISICLRRLAIFLLAGVLIYGAGWNIMVGAFEKSCCTEMSANWSPSWSADGNRISFVSYSRAGSYYGGITRIYTMNKDGSDVTQLTSHFLDNIDFLRNFFESFSPMPRDDMPAWSPDGKQIVFVRGPAPHQAMDIYIMDADGSNPKLIMSRSKIPLSSIVVLGSDGNVLLSSSSYPPCCFDPAWSRDGKRIAFFDDYDHIYVVDTDGSNLNRVADSYGNSNHQLFWSPDSRYIAYAKQESIDRDIFIVNSDGTGGEKQLTQRIRSSWSLAWSPSGDRIAFISQDDDSLFVIDSDGTNLTKLVDVSGSQSLLSWSPDGMHFAIIGDLNGQGNGLYLLNSDGTNIVQLLGLPDFPKNRSQNWDKFSWSPDGGLILFSFSRKIYVVETDGTILFQSPTE